ncbi:uncharacterized protein BDV17DRAFT_280586 [Aspergillus undulatus]|uniref:uncharacterized protein n=1 Tax=Aspergillus undulatus TaxID=1810928 RepID=UPI003CCCF1AC
MSARRGQSSRKRPVRLPIIAPKDDVASGAHVGAPATARATIVQPRLRFPPRSRTGCWYQCARLGHVCDYQPRLCFRDDTRRVMERMPDVKTKGNAVWDREETPSSKMSRRKSHLLPSDPEPCDLLPEFSRLTSDEERERKAQGSAPGTYHVVVVPESFARLPEYTEDTLDTVLGNPYSSPLSEYSSYDPMDEVTTSEDPNVVILNQFKDSRKQAYSSRRSCTQSPESDLGPSSVSAAMMYTPLQDISEDQITPTLDLETYDMALLDHFQNVVWMQLIPATHGYMEANIFEQEASSFPPLLHVMMALSALSLVHQGNAHYMVALQYYGQTLPSLQDSLLKCDVVLSDGLFLTHFLLLIYQIAFTTPSNVSALWSHHLSRLLQLSLLRHTVSERVRYPLIIWLICQIDLYALMSGSGTGEYIRAAIESNLLPEVESLLRPVGFQGSSILHSEEYNAQSLVMRLYRECFVLATHLGLYIAEAKRSKMSHLDPPFQELENIRGRLKRLWNSDEVRFLMESRLNLSKRSQHSFHQLSVLFHTSLLLSCEIFWRTQGIHIYNELEKEVQYHADAILHFADQMVAHGRHGGPLFLNFSLLLSGAVTLLSGTKMAALELLAKLRKTEFGYGAAMTSAMLQTVCETQLQHSRAGGHLREIDWMEVAANHGNRLVSFG